MTKSELLGVYQTAENHIQLTYASMVFWCYPDSPLIFKTLYEAMSTIPKPFPHIETFLTNEPAMRIACEEIYDSAHRAAIKELLPLTKTYCHETGQLDSLKSQPWFQFWRILRNCFAHDMVFNFNEAEKALLPVTWSGVTIDLSINNKHLTHGKCSREKLRELLKASRTFIEEAT